MCGVDLVLRHFAMPSDHCYACGSVPNESMRRQVCDVIVVTVGTREPTLAKALSDISQKAKTDGKELLVMLRTAGCKPCDDQLKALPQDLMQKALSPVVLVIVDKEVFRDDLKQLKAAFLPEPNYLLLAPDMTPRDQIDGGEWGE